MDSPPIILPGQICALPLVRQLRPGHHIRWVHPRHLHPGAEINLAQRLRAAGLPVYYERHLVHTTVVTADGRRYPVACTPDFMLPGRNRWTALELKDGSLTDFTAAKLSLLWAACGTADIQVDLTVVFWQANPKMIYTSIEPLVLRRLLYFLGFSSRSIERWIIKSIEEILRPLDWSLTIIAQRLQPLPAAA